MSCDQADGPAHQQIRCTKSREARENEDIMEHQRSLDLANVPVPRDLDDLVKILRETFSNNCVNIEYVTKLLSNYKSNPQEWSKYAKYDPSKLAWLL